MGLRINTNIGALTAHNSTVHTARFLDSSLERLSTGLRINAAKDDASGLAIAEPSEWKCRMIYENTENAKSINKNKKVIASSKIP